MEIFIPRSGITISLPGIPGNRRVGHTLTGNVICGGLYPGTSDNCFELKSDGTGWGSYISPLTESRMAHSSWNSPDGIVLLGGYFRGTKVEILKNGCPGGSCQLPDFPYDIR